MLGLPKSTEVSKQLPKTAIYEKFNMDNAAREKFDADISKIFIAAEITPATVNIEKGEKVDSVFVLRVILKHREFAEKTVTQITKLIEQNMLLVLEFDGEQKLAIFHTKLIQSCWKAAEDYKITLTGLTLDAVWDNIVIQVGNISVENGNSVAEQIAINDERAKIQKEIDRLEKLAKKEKQPKKKYEFFQMINDLKKEL